MLIPVYTRVLTVSDYGVISTLAPLAAMLMYFYNLGLSGAVMRYDAELSNVEERKIAHGTAWVFLILMAIGTSAFFSVIGPFIWKLIFPEIPMYPFAYLVLGIVAIGSTNVVPMALLRIRGKAIAFSTIQFLQFLTVTSLIIYFVVVLRLGAKGQLIALLLNALIFAVVYIAITMREIKINLNAHYLKKYLSFGLPLIPSGLSIWVISLSNLLILQRLRSLEEVGLFALGYKFGLIMDVLIVAMLTAWQPFFYNKAEEGKGTELFSQVGTYYMFVVLGTGAAILLGTQQVLHIATTPKFFAAGRVVGLVVVGIVFRAMYLFNVQGISFRKKTHYLPFIDGTAAILNVILSLWLIPRHGMMGAAFSTMIAYSVQFACGFIVSKSLYPIPYQYSRLIRIALIYVLSFVGLSRIGFNSDVWTLLVRLGLLPVLVLAGLLLFRVPEDREIRKITDILRQIRKQFSTNPKRKSENYGSTDSTRM